MRSWWRNALRTCKFKWWDIAEGCLNLKIVGSCETWSGTGWCQTLSRTTLHDCDMMVYMKSGTNIPPTNISAQSLNALNVAGPSDEKPHRLDRTGPSLHRIGSTDTWNSLRWKRVKLSSQRIPRFAYTPKSDQWFRREAQQDIHVVISSGRPAMTCKAPLVSLEFSDLLKSSV